MSESQRVIAGRYELGPLIGRGGMAEVYEGLDTRLGRKVAIKLLKADLAADPTFDSRFRQEAQASARMAHPTIVRVYDAGEDIHLDQHGAEQRRPFIIMEFVRGKLLRELLHERRISVQEAVEYAQGVLTALEFSHRAGIVHRDIKAANIMITESGQVKVMDFGIARTISESSITQSHTQGIVGTAQYFSPEQARGETVDARTDIYSTGVLLYEMLAGRPPFKGDSAVSVAYQHVSEAVSPPSSHNPLINSELDAVVLRALAKDRNERFQTAEEFREHLASASLVAPEHPVPPPVVQGMDPAPSPLGIEDPGFDNLIADAAADATTVIAQPDPFAQLGFDIPSEPAVAEPAQAATDPQPIPAPIAPAGPVSAAAAASPAAPAFSPAGEAATERISEAGSAAEASAAAMASDSQRTTKEIPPLPSPGSAATEAIPGLSTVSNPIPQKRESGTAASILWGLGSAATVIIIGLVIWLVSFGNFKFDVVPTTSNITVADVTGAGYQDGYNTLAAQQLIVTRVYEISQTVPVDTIIRTEPAAGVTVPPGTPITVYVSSGPSLVKVPNLLGLDEQSAQLELERVGLVLGSITLANSPSVATGRVLQSDPALGIELAEGSIVNIVISNGQVVVPDVRNLAIADALKLLRGPELMLPTSVSTQETCTGTPGTTVISQSVDPGPIDQGTPVVLYVECIGAPEPSPTPEPSL